MVSSLFIRVSPSIRKVRVGDIFSQTAIISCSCYCVCVVVVAVSFIFFVSFAYKIGYEDYSYCKGSSISEFIFLGSSMNDTYVIITNGN